LLKLCFKPAHLSETNALKSKNLQQAAKNQSGNEKMERRGRLANG
jgi:hypothetical protein